METSGFVGMVRSEDCGSVESPSVDLGNGATFSFTNVTGWNNSDTGDVNDVRALTGDHHFFSNWNGSGPGNFSFEGLASERNPRRGTSLVTGRAGRPP